MLIYPLLSINQTTRIYCHSQCTTERGTGSPLIEKLFYLHSAGSQPCPKLHFQRLVDRTVPALVRALVKPGRMLQDD